jgi:hypothetical protein
MDTFNAAKDVYVAAGAQYKLDVTALRDELAAAFVARNLALAEAQTTFKESVAMAKGHASTAIYNAIVAYEAAVASA